MLKSKVAIITGGANGIGKATVKKFVENGASVAIWDVDEDAGKKLEKELKSQSYNCKFYKVNITSLEDTEKATSQVLEDYGAVHILINNAGITRDATLIKMTPEQWKQVIDVNLTGVFNCTKAVAPSMKEQKEGRIISASSVVGIYGNFGQTNYVATKSGVIGMTKVWARELGKYGITVNAVAPGFIKTEMIDSVPEKVIDIMVNQSAVKRLGEVEDIANAYLFLSSALSSFVTGTVLSVDGGLVN